MITCLLCMWIAVSTVEQKDWKKKEKLHEWALKNKEV